MSYIIHESDGSKEYHPNQTDLVSNRAIFNQAYDSKRLTELENFNDDTDYSNYPTLEEILEDYDPQKYTNRSFTVRVHEKYIWSSDGEHLGGYDRPLWLLRKSNDDKCRENIRKPFNGEARGFRDADCNVLNGWIRVNQTT